MKFKEYIVVYMLIYTLAIFASGIFVGKYYLHKRHFPPPHHGKMSDSKGRADMMRKHMAKKLDLTEEQLEKVDAILEKYKPEIEEKIKEIQIGFDQNREKIKKEISEVLNPDQIKKLQEIEAKIRSRHGDPMEHRPPGHRPPGPPPPPLLFE